MTCARLHPPAANDEGMLLCDGCDGGYHLSCLRPKLTSIPDGAWFCTHCAGKHDKTAVTQQLIAAAAGTVVTPRRAGAVERAAGGQNPRLAQRRR